MGLDCFVRVSKPNQERVDEIWYGRKENEIHGWMQRQSGVAAGDFNCVELPLTEEMLDALEQDASKGLVPTSGFFFGSAGATDEVLLAVQELVAAARAALARGDKPYYFSWW